MFINSRILSSCLNRSSLLALTAVVGGYQNELFCKCSEETKKKSGNEDDTFLGYFPMKQLYQPKRPYPAWDNDWDGKDHTYDSASKEEGVTRHLILIRHGQYDETFKDDAKRRLTTLGQEQAHLTGKRLAELIKGIDDKFKPCNVNVIHVSDMTRAKETASIISEYLPKNVIRTKPDPLLNEGIPAQIIPKRPELDIGDDLTRNGPRIEEAFVKYFFRNTDDTTIKTKQTNGEKNNQEKHEFDIIVCHGNVIRYFFCRALQLPPEAWLRLSIFNCSLTYLMIMPNGRVSCRMLGDIGHLGLGHSTFSMNHGFAW